MKRPILYIVIPFCLGILTSRLFNIPLIYPAISSVAFLTLAILRSHRNIFSHVVLYLAVFFFGMAYYQNSITLPADHISRHAHDEPQKVLVRGVIADDPVTSSALYGKKKTVFVLRAEAIEKRDKEGAIGGKKGPVRRTEGLIRVSVYSDKGADVSFGDELILEGLLSKPHSLKNPGVFDYEEYLAIKDIYAVLNVKEELSVKKLGNRAGCFKNRAYRFRNAIRNIFNKYLEEPYSGFLNAINIGDRSELSEELKDDFVKTGTVHILAISGLNVGLIAAIFLALFGILKMPRKVSLSLTLLFLVFYSLVAGSNPPIIRATVMFAVFVIGYLINREADALNSLSLAAFLILLWNPRELFDPSFQLSFASLAGIIILVPKMNELTGFGKITGNGLPHKIFRYLFIGIATSIAAWLGTWPIVLSYFNIISPVSVLANIIAVPLLFVLTAVSFIFAAAGFVLSFLAALVAPALRIIEDFLFVSNHFFAALPFAYFRAGAPSTAFFILYYALIFSAILPSEIGLRKAKINKGSLILAVLFCFNLLIWKEVIPFRKDILKMHFLDVGHGDSIFIELPGKGNILIDGGSGGQEGMHDIGKSAVAPYLWNKGIRRIDAVIVTHFHADHLGGLIYILKNFKVGCVVDNGSVISGSGIYDEYKRVLREKGVRRFAAADGDVIEAASGVRFFVLNPQKRSNFSSSESEENDNSVVLKLVYKDFSALFCGDVTSGAMERIIPHGQFLKSDLLKVPHHGGHLGDEEIVLSFLEITSPKICVTSSGKISKYNSKSANMPEYISHLNSISYDTNRDGEITISVDGKSNYSGSCYITKN